MSAPESPVNRRNFLGKAAAACGAAALAGCWSKEDVEAFFQKSFRALSPEQIATMITRLEAKYKQAYSRDVSVSVEPAKPGVEFAYALDLSRCVGCRRCVYACVRENNQSRNPPIQWISVLQLDKDKGVDLVEGDMYYEPESVPEEGHFYMPVQCHHCRNAPCVKSCPVGATWTEPDGIVVIDYDWCIGCRCCMAACPYGARRFNWGNPTLPAGEVNPEMHVLGNRPRPKGIVEKCTFCIQRVRKGRYPACVEICPVGARKFGNLLDPKSEVRYILENKRVYILKEDLATEPRFYYFYGL